MQTAIIAVVLCYNIKFLICFFFNLLCFLVESFLVFLNTGVNFRTCGYYKERLQGLYGLGLIDVFNLRGIIKPLN